MALAQPEKSLLQPPEYRRLLKLLAKVRLKSKALIIGEAALRSAFALVAAIVVGFALDNLVHLPWVVRLALAVAIPVGGVWYFVRLARDAFEHWRADRVAVRLERAYPELRNQLINAIQLGREPASETVAAVIRRIVADAAEQGTRLSLDRAFSLRPLKRWFFALAAALFLFVLYAAFLPGHFRNAAERFIRPRSGVLPVTRVYLEIEPGNALVARGDSLVIKGLPRGPLPQRATIRFRKAGQTTEFDMVFDGSSFVHVINDLQETMKYQVRAEDFRSNWFTLRVAEKPEVTRFLIRYRYPPYTRLGEKVFRSTQGHIRAVVGTRVEVEAWTNQPVVEAQVVDERGRKMPSRLDQGSKPPDGGGTKTSRIRFETTVERDGSYSIIVRNEQNFSNRPAPVYTIKAVRDMPPNVMIQSPRDSIEVPEGRDIPVLYVASDDFGLASLKATISREDGSDRRTVERRGFSTPTLRVEDGFRLSLKGYKIGDELLLSLIARDANPFASGMTISDPLRIRIVDPKKVAESELEKFDALEGDLADAKAGEAKTTETLTTLEDERITTRTDLVEKLKKIHDKIDEFVEVQQRVIKTTKDLAKVPPEKMTDQQLGELKDVANTEDDWAKYFKEAATDLSRVPETKAVDSALVDELVEIYSEIKEVAENLQPKNIEMYVPLEQLGAELAEKLSNRMEEWLPDISDHIKWDLEEPPAPLDVPLAELPDELEDLMGDLIEQEEDMTDDIEDVSSSWADSMSDAGWGASDGPISNFSAVGKTGNTLPNNDEISGRSGEGRTGKSHGEFVEKTAVGKGGRKTPTRLTPDQFEEGIVQDKSKEGTGGSTGGGKRAGWGGQGLTGPTPPITQDQGIRLAGRQADIREKAQKLSGLLKRYQLPTAKLDEAIGRMREIERMARSYRYDGIAAIHRVALKDLRENRAFVREKIRIRREQVDSIPPRVRHQITEGLQEEFPEGYEDLVKTYYEVLSGTAAGSPPAP